MAEHVLTGGLILFDGLDLSNSLNQITLDHSAEAKDSTAIGHTTRRRIGGLKESVLSAAGFFEAAEPDASLFAAAGASDKVITVSYSQTLGEVAYFLKALLGEYQPFGGGVGDLAGFQMNAGCSDGDLIRGRLMELGTQTATGNGTGRQLGTVAAGQSIYAALHVLTVAGTTPSLVVKIQSDDNAGFISPVDRITFNSANAVGAQFGSQVGAIADDYWRAVWTIGGTGPSFRFAVALGIQAT